MQFFIASTFTDSLTRLTNQEQALIKKAAFDFQLDPSNPGFQFHRLHRAREKNFWSFRVTRDLRTIVYLHQENFTLVYCGHHDKAYQWAQKRRFEIHPTTGAIQIIELDERVEEIVRKVVTEVTQEAPLFARYEVDYLLALGVPVQWVDWLRTATEEQFLELAEHLPEEATERLMCLAAGEPVATPQPLSGPPNPFAHPDSQRRFQPISDLSTLQKIMDAPWEKWMVFLHPTQRQMVEHHQSGAALVTGGAGTGKTVVALHRCALLARQDPQARILLTTYTTTLAHRLHHYLDLLLGAQSPERARVTVQNLHQVARNLAQHAGRAFRPLDDKHLIELMRASGQALNQTSFSAEFLLAEWKAIIDPNHLRDWKSYRNIARTGRGRALGAVEKKKIWEVCQEVLVRMQRRGLSTWAALCHDATQLLTQNPHLRFTHVVADEAQDFSMAELRLLRALATEGANDLFLVGDNAQRIYPGRFSWKSAGIHVQGRARKLRVNYRTSEEIRRFAEGLLPRKMTSLDGEEHARQQQSLFSGPAPTRHAAATPQGEIEALARWLKDVLKDGLAPEEIAIFARTHHLRSERATPALRQLGLDWQELRRDTLPGSGKICMGTMHSAKGLEFRAVALVGCDQSALPLLRALEGVADEGDQDQIVEQERNLLYVACTRARERLFLSHTGAPSPFLTPADAPARTTTPSALPSKPEVRPAAWRPPFKISPSRIARYFYHGCQRYLRYSAASTEARLAADRVPRLEREESPVTAAVMESGGQWEVQVLERHLGSAAHLAQGEGPLHQRYFTWENSLGLLRDARPGSWIYQPTLRAPEHFYQRYQLDPRQVHISDNRPDLIQVLDAPQGSGRLLRLVDMKRGAAVRSTHQIQILFYALELESILAEASILDARVDLQQGAVWLGGQAHPSLCDLEGVRPHLESLLAQDLSAVLEAPLEEVRWHVQARCEWCPFFDHCRTQMQQSDDLSRLAYLSSHGKNFLWDRHTRDLPALRDLLQQSEPADQALQHCASLRGQRLRLLARTRALQENRPQLHGQATLSLPRRTDQDIELILTLQREPLGGLLYAAGLKLNAGPAVSTELLRRRGGQETRYQVAPGPQDSPMVQRWLVMELYTLLQRIDAFNLAQPWPQKLRLQVYTYSNLERDLLLETLMQARQHPVLAQAAEELLFHFQGPELLLAQEHPEEHVASPVVPLLATLSGLMALPVEVSYTLPEVLHALGHPNAYPRHERFHFPLGHALRSEPIHEAWFGHGLGAQAMDELRQQLVQHLDAVHLVLQALRQQASDEIYGWAPRFQLPEVFPVGDPFLSRLIFLTRYESFLRFEQTRSARLIAREEIPTTEGIHELVAQEYGALRMIAPPARLPEASSFANWLLVSDDRPGRRALMSYPDYYYRRDPWKARPNPHRAVVSLPQVDHNPQTQQTLLQVKFASKQAALELRADQRYLLYPRFSDYTTDKVVAFLAALEGHAHPLRSLLCEPESPASGAKPLPAPLRQAAQALEEDMGLTLSQREAWRALQQLQTLAIWGPPGTGKTHFLASVVLGMMRAHRAQNLPFRVILTAFTHTAIENLLRKIHQLATANAWGDGLHLGKAQEWKGPALGDRVDPRRFQSWLNQCPFAVVGATVYQLLKDPNLKPVDMVIVDEASQMEVPLSMIPASLAGQQGRLLFAGDHCQLPPIIAGQYPEPEPGEPVLHRSIFEALLSVQGGTLVRQLLENFRMNDVLTSYAAHLLYGPGYTCAQETVAQRRLCLELPNDTQALLHTCLDPSSPLVLAVMDGTPPSRESPQEAHLVTQLASCLRQHMLTPQGEPWESDAQFWSHGLFIISPHHSQIDLIQQALGQTRSWESPPFVDTVDKMQGQEADAVIVSYGVSDAEYAQREAAFIYSLNRLNVSLTRGRAKTVVFLSRALLEATPGIVEDKAASEGLAYMRHLWKTLQRQGHNTSFLLEDGVTLDLYCAHQPVYNSPPKEGAM